MFKPLNNITFLIISSIFISLYSYSIYQNHTQFEYAKKQENKIVKEISMSSDINQTGFFSSMYLKTKNLFN